MTREETTKYVLAMRKARPQIQDLPTSGKTPRFPSHLRSLLSGANSPALGGLAGLLGLGAAKSPSRQPLAAPAGPEEPDRHPMDVDDAGDEAEDLSGPLAGEKTPGGYLIDPFQVHHPRAPTDDEAAPPSLLQRRSPEQHSPAISSERGSDAGHEAEEKDEQPEPTDRGEVRASTPTVLFGLILLAPKQTIPQLFSVT